MSAPTLPQAETSLVERLAAIVGKARVLVREGELRAYESDGLPGYHARPSVAVFPGTRDETIAVVRLLAPFFNSWMALCFESAMKRLPALSIASPLGSLISVVNSVVTPAET